MNILYVAPLVVGFQDILEGKRESMGLPSFIFPLKKLLEMGNKVDIILISNYKKSVNIHVDWIKKNNIIANINNDIATTKGIKRYFLKIKSFFQLYCAIRRALITETYDFVYCHGTAAYLGNVLANRYKVRCGYRIYGVVNVAHDIKMLGFIRSVLKYPIYFKIFREDKEFLLITDDGTDGNYVHTRFNPKSSFPIFFWVNGVDKTFDYKSQDEILNGNNCFGRKYIFQPGRISRIKRQDRTVNILHKLHDAGCKLHLFFAGHVSDDSFYKELQQLINSYDLEQYVHFLGAIERAKMQSLSHDAIATILPEEISNQGNVFFECALAGSVIITYLEESLKKYMENMASGFFVQDEKDAADIVLELFENKYDTEAIRNALKRTVDSKLQSWEERARKEIELIYGRNEYNNNLL